jgi:hypothetical protein
MTVQPVTISDADFHDLICQRAQHLLGLIRLASERKTLKQILIRPLLGDLLSQSMQLEELLDAYDARNNCRWCSFRSLIATIKLFSNVCYELLHIKHSLPAYRLLPIEDDFVLATEQVLEFTSGIIRSTSEHMLMMSEYLGLTIPSAPLREESYCEKLPPGRLPRNCHSHKKEVVSEMIALLATSFLNLAASSKEVRNAARATPEEYPECLKAGVREETLRGLELRFHNLQSQYDTYVSGTHAEKEDTELLVLRGHISVVFHLLKTATMFLHYYERHSSKKTCVLATLQDPLVGTDHLLNAIMQYSIKFANTYITCAERLCRSMLKRYSEVGSITLAIPKYRGFHVRPSTLISKLVLHYGCDVTMQLGSEVYDAQMPLELFRANEKINAEKRRWLASEILRLKLVPEDSGEVFEKVARRAVLALAERGKIMLYEQPLKLPDEPAARHGTMLDRVVAEVTRLLALGKIDIESDIEVTFTGDTRVLADLKLLAEAGYGEDKFGNNIPLPEMLQYLRR